MRSGRWNKRSSGERTGVTDTNLNKSRNCFLMIIQCSLLWHSAREGFSDLWCISNRLERNLKHSRLICAAWKYFRAILREIESSNLEHCFGVDSGLSGQTFGTQLRRGNVMMIHSPFTIQIPKILTWSTGIF